MKKLFLIMLLPLIGLSFALGQTKVEKYDVLYLEAGEFPRLYFYPAEIGDASEFSISNLFGDWAVDPIKIQDSESIVCFDSIITNDSTNACYINKLLLNVNDTLLLIEPKSWSDWLFTVTKEKEPLELTRIGPFFFKDSYKESGYMYFFDFPRHYRIKREYPDITICNTKIDAIWIYLDLGHIWKKNDPLLITNKKSVGYIDIDGDEIKKKNWLKELDGYDWVNQKK